MYSDFDRPSLAAGRRRSLSAIAVAIVVSSFAAPTSAATLNGTTYDLLLLGHVQNAAGTQLSVEGYSASPVFDAFSTNVPNTLVATPDPPFDLGNTLRVDESEAGDTAIIWIRGPANNPNDTFTNMLQPNSLVQLHLTLRFDEVGPLEKVVITDVRPENGSHGFYDADSWAISAPGTATTPVQLLVNLDPADIQGTFPTSHVKLQFDFMTMVIPEPATATLAALGALGAYGLVRRRRVR